MIDSDLSTGLRRPCTPSHPTKSAPPGTPGGARRVEPRDFVGTPGPHPKKSAPRHRDFLRTPGSRGPASAVLAHPLTNGLAPVLGAGTPEARRAMGENPRSCA